MNVYVLHSQGASASRSRKSAVDLSAICAYYLSCPQGIGVFFRLRLTVVMPRGSRRRCLFVFVRCTFQPVAIQRHVRLWTYFVLCNRVDEKLIFSTATYRMRAATN